MLDGSLRITTTNIRGMPIRISWSRMSIGEAVARSG